MPEPEESGSSAVANGDGLQPTGEATWAASDSAQARQKQLNTVTGLLLGNELLERLAFYGLSSNLITYLTTQLNTDPAAAAAQVNNFWGATYLTPLLGAFVADSWLGRYPTIVYASLIYLMGFVLVSLCPTLPALHPAPGESASAFQLTVFFIGLYLTAFGSGAIKPCVSTFGADQYREDVPAEAAMLARFFNWFYIAVNIGSFLAATVVVYLQQQVSWVWGFWVNAAAFTLALLLLLSGRKLYRLKKPTGSPMAQMAKALSAAWVKRKLPLPLAPDHLYEAEDNLEADKPTSAQVLTTTNRMRWLDKGAVQSDSYSVCWLVSVQEIEEVKQILALLPYFFLMIIYNMVYNQMNSLFILQGNTMDGHVFGVVIPAASLSLFNTVAVIICTILYDSYVKAAFEAWGRPITSQQQVGVGFLLSVATMAISALVEIWRLKLVAQHGLEHTDPTVTPVPMCVLWQVPIYFVLGVSEIFANVGCMELFYGAAPPSMRALASSLYLLSSSFGAYATSGLLSLLSLLTDQDGNGGWIAHNLNTARVDLFFWLLAALQFVDYLAYLWVVRTPSSRSAAAKAASTPISRASSQFGTMASVTRFHPSFSAGSRVSASALVADTITTPLLGDSTV